MSRANDFLDYASDLMQTIKEKEKESIEKAAVALKDTMARGGMLYTFGTGHSTMLCREPYMRAGGLVSCYPIIDERVAGSGTIKNPGAPIREREEGLTAEIFKEYPLKKGDTMIVFCYGGKNATSVDACLLCKEMGVTSIGISSVEHALGVGPHHSSGLLVHQACDISIDNHGRMGDASLDFDGFTACPISTVVGAAIVQAITARAMELMMAEGIQPEVLLSANVPGGDEHNRPLMEKFRNWVAAN